jgi:hypothetical protein
LYQSGDVGFWGSCAGQVTPVAAGVSVGVAEAVPADSPNTADVAAAMRTPRTIVFLIN